MAAGRGPARKEWARAQVELIGAELGRQQEMLYASAKGAAGRAAPPALRRRRTPGWTATGRAGCCWFSRRWTAVARTAL
ncbi:hypothetical protein V2I01_10360 [Micromonospora sp. BRA006-A]|nr:hypothetical protein [Micromonospora sp. BRA006-A]